MKPLQRAVAEGSFLLDLKATDMESVIHQGLNVAVAKGYLPAERRDTVEEALIRRESLAPTAIGNAVAVPHAYLDCIERPIIIFLRLAQPLNLGAPDHIPTRFVIMLLGPVSSAVDHLDALAGVARLMSDDEFRYQASMAANGGELVEALEAYRKRAQPAKPPEPSAEYPGLEVSSRLAGGLMSDIRRRLPYYWSDLRDGLHSKTVSSTFFLFFACLAPAVTFGGVMGFETGGQIGAVEMLLATTICGVLFALCSGQPLVILGGTGPLLVFTVILYKLCQTFEIPFLPTYAWVGLWTCAFVVLLAITNASYWMRYFTRFTDETFAALISLIYIVEAGEALLEEFHEAYEVPSRLHDKAFLSLILALGTFYIATNLSRFRRSRYLVPWVREFLSDFGPAIAIAAMTAVALWFGAYVQVDTLQAPERFGPSLAGRPWLLDLTQTPVLFRWAAAIPAALAAILVFLDQNITARLVNSPRNRLLKGPAYHLDLMVVGLLIGLCSILGLPWLVAATVRSLNHLRSLASVEEVVTSEGNTHERIIHVRENRITALAIHALVGLSLLLLPYLRLIPMPVLFGLFLYMGFVSMSGNQFFERLSLWLMDRNLYPSTHYLRRASRSTIHAFTALQLACLALLWVVKTSRLGILFPLFIALLVPVRNAAERFLPREELDALDAEEEPEEEVTSWSG